MRDWLMNSGAKLEGPDRQLRAVEPRTSGNAGGKPTQIGGTFAVAEVQPRMPTALTPFKPPPTLAIVDAAELLTVPAPPRKWLITDVIPADDVTLFSGDGAAGKTTISLQLAAAVALGHDWIGLPVASGNVLFFSAEDSISELHFRLGTICKSDAPPPSGRLHLCSTIRPEDAKPLDPTLVRYDRDGQMTMTPLCEALRRFVMEHSIRLLIIDAVAEVFGGNENDRGHVAAFARQLQHLALKAGCAIVLLSHPSVQGMASGRGYSGSTHWNAGVKSRLFLQRPKASVGKIDDGRRTLSLEKSNRSQSGTEIDLTWVDGQYVPESADNEGPVGLGQAESVVLELVRRYNEEGRDISAKPSSTHAPKLFADEPEAQCLPGRRRKELLTRAMNNLIARRRLRQITEGSASRPRGRLVLVPLQ